MGEEGVGAGFWEPFSPRHVRKLAPKCSLHHAAHAQGLCIG